MISAPSGCGKSTIIGSLFDAGDLNLCFSVSATNRAPRAGETDGQHYHFMSTEEFRQAIADGKFIEWEQVYPGRYYGTLRSEIDRCLSEGHNVILDIDVNGALNVKEQYGRHATTIFVEPPSIEALRQRLEHRGTDSDDVIDQRISRAQYELDQAPQFDHRIVNDRLDDAVAAAHRLIAGKISGGGDD